MAFLHSVIGDNTPENREHLEKIGYDISCPCVRFRTSSLFTDNGGEVHTFQEEELGECLLEIKQGKCDLINCIGNPQLFQAVSAMRDDSDYLQWFKENVNEEIYEADWELCETGQFPHWEYTDTSFHKATLSELQAHFQRI